jgi:pimeloyl-ACP methyl ester carboxylesterase
MTYAAMVDDVLGWLDAHAPHDAVTLLGHSMGGKAAMLLACRHPERVRQLFVVDIAPRDYHSAAHRAEFAAMNELRLEELHTRAEAELRFEARVPDWAMRKFLATNLERSEDGRWRWMINLPALTEGLPHLEVNALRPSDVFDGPTVFVAGEKSRYVRPEDHAAVRRHFPAAEIVTMAGAGHNPHMETREAFVAAVRARAVH